jgi:hypothetical protein
MWLAGYCPCFGWLAKATFVRARIVRVEIIEVHWLGELIFLSTINMLYSQ